MNANDHGTDRPERDDPDQPTSDTADGSAAATRTSEENPQTTSGSCAECAHRTDRLIRHPSSREARCEDHEACQRTRQDQVDAEADFIESALERSGGHCDACGHKGGGLMVSLMGRGVHCSDRQACARRQDEQRAATEETQ